MAVGDADGAISDLVGADRGLSEIGGADALVLDVGAGEGAVSDLGGADRAFAQVIRADAFVGDFGRADRAVAEIGGDGVVELGTGAPAINAVEEMVNMMSASRSYQSSIEAMNTAKELMTRTLSIGR